MLDIQNLSKSFQSTPVLKGLTLKLEPSHIYGLIGKNGIGKTTLLNCLTGVLNPDEGKILSDEKEIQADLLNYKRQIAYTPDESVAFDYLTGKEYLEFMVSVYFPTETKKEDPALEKKIKDTVHLFDMEPYLSQLIGTYSHGTKQKIALIAAYLHDPKYWFLDEPLLGLDPKATGSLFSLFREEKQKGNTILLSLHDISAASDICDTVFLLSDGKISKTYTDVKEDAFAIDALRELKA
jgi:ABC-2 type transport system ATP-binding protein